VNVPVEKSPLVTRFKAALALPANAAMERERTAAALLIFMKCSDGLSPK